MKSEKLIFFLVIFRLTFSKTILINDPKLDYEFHDDVSDDFKPNFNSSATFSTTLKTSELEVEENVMGSAQNTKQTTNLTSYEKPTESDSYGVETVSMCSMDADKFNIKISQLLDKFVPDQLNLKPVVRGALAKVYLQNGKLMINKDYQIAAQPSCTEVDDKTKQYEIMLSLKNLMGSYDWKIYNLFGYNFSESALLTVKEIITELKIVEKSDLKTKLKDITMGKIDGIDVNVNIPERITTISYLKPMLEYIISRITTIIANGSMDTITKNMKEVFLESIQEKVKINP